MPIPFPDMSDTPLQDICHRIVNGETNLILVDELKDAFVDAGWTAVNLRGYAWFQMASDSYSDGRTFWLNGRAYVFKNTIDNNTARHIKVGASAAESVMNAVHCVNDDGVGKGTLYSNATSGDPDFVATYGQDDTRDAVYRYLYVWGKVGGVTAAENSCTLSISNNGYINGVDSYWNNNGSLTNFGYRLLSPKTPDGFRVVIEICCTRSWPANNTHRNSTRMQWGLGSPTKVRASSRCSVNRPTWTLEEGAPAKYLSCDVSRDYHIIAHKYHAFVYLMGNVASQGWVCAGTLAVPEEMRPVVVTNATGGGTQNVSIRVPSHGFGDPATGVNVYCAGAEGLEFDGAWSATITDGDWIMLNDSSSVATGSYVADSANCANTDRHQIARLVFGGWNGTNTTTCHRFTLAAAGGYYYIVENAMSVYGSNGTYAWRFEFNPNKNLHWLGSKYWTTEAAMMWGDNVDSGPFRTRGWLYGGALVSLGMQIDAESVDINGQNWIVWEPQSTTEGNCLVLAVPMGTN